MKNWTVYKHISPSGKVYVGISSNVKNRWAANGYYYHLSDTAFSRALKKYGWENFQHLILQEGLSKQEACDMEKELIAYYKAKGISYNITNGGEGYAGKHSEEHNRHKIEARLANSDTDYLVIDKDFNYIICQTEKEAAEFLGGVQRNISHILRQPIGYTFKKHYIWKHKKGTPVDIDSIKKQIKNVLDLRYQRQSEIGKSNAGKNSEALRKRAQAMTVKERKAVYGNSNKCLGKHHSEETKKRMSEIAKGRDMSKAVDASLKVNRKPIVQMLNGLVINTFDSVNEAAKYIGVSASSIGLCASGKRKTAKGYSWKYKKEMEVNYAG